MTPSPRPKKKPRLQNNAAFLLSDKARSSKDGFFLTLGLRF